MDNRYTLLRKALAPKIANERLINDPLLCLAYGTDASFYRLVPQLVVRIISEEEVVNLLYHAHRLQTPVTFRAAGTSLSGQAVTDSVLAVLEGDHWRNYEILDNGEAIRLQSGIIGAQANRYLAPYGRKIGPDPASINSCKIGGIAANNASGMCCGVDHNSYKTLRSMRLILADGTLLDTASDESRRQFEHHHAPLLALLRQLSYQVRHSQPLAERIRNKYRIKNTTGYSLNALVDFEDPFEILQHLMIGSEGTLGFISEITYRTVVEHPHKASALILFPNTTTACEAVPLLKQQPVDAVEMMDRAALRSVENNPGMDPVIQTLPERATALLVETRAEDPEQLQQQVNAIEQSLAPLQTLGAFHFTDQPDAFEQLWKIRKGLFPAVGAVREPGTTVVIEDIAFPIEHLAAGTEALHQLFQQFHYSNAIIFGHALEGNLHFVITPNFNRTEEVENYHQFMDALSHMVVDQFDGSLKAEHSTGRNMAPYVELEWGKEAYQLMQQIKQLFDPEGLLNPGVILNPDQTVHIKNLKPMPAVDPLVDRCIECGFCEPICPSRNLSLTPRQRIVSLRHTQDNHRTELPSNFRWLTLDTCAADGLCATRCPVGINTGEMVLQQRSEQLSSRGEKIAHFSAKHIPTITRSSRFALNTMHHLSQWIGTSNVEWSSQKLSQISGEKIPRWDRWTPRGASLPKPQQPSSSPTRKAVYFSACVTQSMGSASNDSEKESLNTLIQRLFIKANIEMITLPPQQGHCCGLPFASKGAKEAAETQLRQLEEALWIASEEGTLPVLCDTSPCTTRMVEQFKRPIPLYEPVRFALQQLIPHLQQHQQIDQVALHIPCSARKLGLTPYFVELAEQCADKVFQPEEEGCCGFAGDKGFTLPALNQSALNRLQQQIPEGCTEGFSTSRTCEIGLSRSSGIHYRSILYLVDRCFRSL